MRRPRYRRIMRHYFAAHVFAAASVQPVIGITVTVQVARHVRSVIRRRTIFAGVVMVVAIAQLRRMQFRFQRNVFRAVLARRRRLMVTVVLAYWSNSNVVWPVLRITGHSPVLADALPFRFSFYTFAIQHRLQIVQLRVIQVQIFQQYQRHVFVDRLTFLIFF